MPIILASSSSYRKKLLEQVNIFAECLAPNIDETPLNKEQPKALALRLAVAKAKAVALKYPNKITTTSNTIIIGSDQVASLNGRHLGKPGNFERAFEQLKAQSGNTILFYTAVCVCLESAVLSDVVTTQVEFRTLDEKEITEYLLQEQPYDCAGSFKSEGLGISLFNRITSDDPTALIGIPLIKTLALIRELNAKNKAANKVSG